MRNRWWSLTLFGLALAGLVGGLISLVHMRFSTGDAYSPGSSLRPDPLGTKALYEALTAHESLSAERNFTPISSLREIDPQASLLFLNCDPWDIKFIAHYEPITRFVRDGGRIVLATEAVRFQAYLPDEDEPETEQPASDENPDKPEEPDVEKKRFETDKEYDEELARSKAFWAGLEIEEGSYSNGDALKHENVTQRLPQRIPWRDSHRLIDYDDSIWTPIYLSGEEVVVIERQYGQGSIVVMMDDYLFSNEALFKHRYSNFLTWVIGNKRKVIFEETHLGVAERGGIAVLMRHYKLGSFILASVCFMGLVIWRGVCPLLPAFSHSKRGNIVRAEHSTEAGLSDLVRRSLPLSTMPRQAYELWKKSFIRNDMDRRSYASEMREIETILSSSAETRGSMPNEVHSRISAIINRKKRTHL